MQRSQPTPSKRKTTYAALATILGAIAGAYSGTVSHADAAQLIATGIIGLTLRSAIARQ